MRSRKCYQNRKMQTKNCLRDLTINGIIHVNHSITETDLINTDSLIDHICYEFINGSNLKLFFCTLKRHFIFKTKVTHIYQEMTMLSQSKKSQKAINKSEVAIANFSHWGNTSKHTSLITPKSACAFCFISFLCKNFWVGSFRLVVLFNYITHS